MNAVAHRQHESNRIWQQGRVMDLANGRARILLEPVDHCARCMEGRGCGAGVFSRLLARKAVSLWLPDRVGLSPGVLVQVGVSPMALVIAAARLYGVPVIGFVAGVAAGPVLRLEGLASDLVSLGLGLAGAVGLAWWVIRKPMTGLDPVIRMPGPTCQSRSGPADA